MYTIMVRRLRRHPIRKHKGKGFLEDFGSGFKRGFLGTLNLAADALTPIKKILSLGSGKRRGKGDVYDIQRYNSAYQPRSAAYHREYAAGFNPYPNSPSIGVIKF